MASESTVSPPGMTVPMGGSCCANCIFVTGEAGDRCGNAEYVAITYNGKVAGEDRFVDGKTGSIVKNPLRFCCNFFDWTRVSAAEKARYEHQSSVMGHYPAGRQVEIVSNKRGKL